MFVAYFLPYGYYNMLQISTKVTSVVTQRDWALTFCAELFQLAPQKKNYAFALRRLNKECRMILQPIHFPIIAFQTDSTTSAVIEIIVCLVKVHEALNSPASSLSSFARNLPAPWYLPRMPSSTSRKWVWFGFKDTGFLSWILLFAVYVLHHWSV